MGSWNPADASPWLQAALGPPRELTPWVSTGLPDSVLVCPGPAGQSGAPEAT